MGMSGKLSLALAKYQLLPRARCPGAHERPFTLDARQDLFPAVVTHILERHAQRLVEIYHIVEQVNRALRLALLQPLLAEAGAERQHFECPKIAPTVGDH